MSAGTIRILSQGRHQSSNRKIQSLQSMRPLVGSFQLEFVSFRSRHISLALSLQKLLASMKLETAPSWDKLNRFLESYKQCIHEVEWLLSSWIYKRSLDVLIMENHLIECKLLYKIFRKVFQPQYSR